MRKRPLNLVDAVAAALFVTMLVTETMADQQQWVFQNKKHALKKSGKVRNLNFLLPTYSPLHSFKATTIKLNA